MENSWFYIIKEGEKPVGAIRIKIMDDGGKRYQNKGYAQFAIREVEQTYGANHWVLETVQEEPGNCHPYEKMGYIWTGKSEKVNGRLILILYYKP
jgi:RimJ/RimL family protein N-acetyltransferase